VRRRWLTRTALTVALGLIAWVAISLTAQAEADEGISPTQVATDCSHGGPYKDHDVWVFDTTKARPRDSTTDTTKARPGDTTTDPAQAGQSDVTGDTTQGDTTQTAQNEPSATFEGPDGQTAVVKINNQVYDLEGHSLAWLSAPAGWRLVASTPTDLKVLGACQAAPEKAAPQAAPGKTAPTNEPAAGARTDPKTLPQTGQDVGAMVTVGAALVGTGIMLLFVRRKRPSPPPPRHRAGDRVWTYPS
jgi:LPXTG-motif cell wall-anchored protein